MTLGTFLKITTDGMILSVSSKAIAAKFYFGFYLGLTAAPDSGMLHAADQNMSRGLVWLRHYFVASS